MRPRLLASLILAAAAAVMGPAALLAAPASPEGRRSVAEMRGELEATLATFPAIAVEYTVRFEPVGPPQPGPGGKPIEPWGPRQSWWAASGRRFAHWREEGIATDIRITHSFDGENWYQVTDHQDGHKEIAITEPRDPGLSMTPAETVGMGLPIAKGSLPEALARPSARAAGVEQVGGVPCERVEVGGLESNREPGILMNLVAWLDPSRGWLPRRVETSYAGDHPGHKDDPAAQERRRRIRFTWEVEEYVAVPNPAGVGGRSWFPRRATYHQTGGRHHLVAERVTIQPEPDPSWFRPSAPAGATVIDYTKGESVPRIVGGPRALERRVAATVEEAAALPDPPRPADATPRRRSWSLYVFVGSSVVLAAAALLWWRTR